MHSIAYHFITSKYSFHAFVCLYLWFVQLFSQFVKRFCQAIFLSFLFKVLTHECVNVSVNNVYEKQANFIHHFNALNCSVCFNIYLLYVNVWFVKNFFHLKFMLWYKLQCVWYCQQLLLVFIDVSLLFYTCMHVIIIYI